jgi:peroxiredoxin
MVPFIILYINAAGQQNKYNYTISATIGEFKDGWVYLMMEGTKGRDSAWARSGQFTFKGNITEPERVFVYRPGSHSALDFFIDKNAAIRVNASTEKFKDPKVTGGVTQTEYNKFHSLTATISKEMEQVERSGIDSLYQQFTIISKRFIKDNTKSFVSIYLLNDLTFSTAPEELDTLFNGLDEHIKKSGFSKIIEDRIAIMKITDVGKFALDFSQPDTLGQTISLSSFKGKYVLLDFWASWCGPCRAENPHVLKAYNQFKDQGFTVLGVSIDNNRKAWIKAVQEDQLPWTHVCDLRSENEAARLYGIHGIPSNFLLDPTGKIIAKNLRGDDLLHKLEDVLSKK